MIERIVTLCIIILSTRIFLLILSLLQWYMFFLSSLNKLPRYRFIEQMLFFYLSVSIVDSIPWASSRLILIMCHVRWSFHVIFIFFVLNRITAHDFVFVYVIAWNLIWINYIFWKNSETVSLKFTGYPVERYRSKTFTYTEFLCSGYWQVNKFDYLQYFRCIIPFHDDSDYHNDFNFPDNNSSS